MPLPLGSDLSPSDAELSARLQQHLLTVLHRQPPATTLWVGCSGGLDSLLLLWAAAAVAPERVRTLHVNHGLQTEAGVWAQQLESLCRDWSVPLTVTSVHIEPGANLEARARQARYAAFERALSAGDCLLLAHHRDDQLETLLLRLTRGAGLEGLSGMPAQRPLGQGTVCRPWLGEPRQDLERLARSLELPWIEDPANQDPRHDRNFVRHDLMPLLRQRWPGVDQALAHSLEHLQTAARRLAVEDDARLSALQTPAGCLDLTGLQNLPTPAERLSVLRRWLQRQGAEDISLHQLEHLYADVVLARTDAQGEVQLGDRVVRRYGEHLYLLTPLPSPPLAPVALNGSAAAGYQAEHGSLGVVTLTPALGAGLEAQRLSQCTLTLRSRQGGERLHPAGRQGSRDLKRLLQELEIPPWQRAHVPLLYADEQLIAVADRVLDQHWCAAPNAPGLVPRWQPPENF